MFQSYYLEVQLFGSGCFNPFYKSQGKGRPCQQLDTSVVPPFKWTELQMCQVIVRAKRWGRQGTKVSMVIFSFHLTMNIHLWIFALGFLTPHKVEWLKSGSKTWLLLKRQVPKKPLLPQPLPISLTPQRIFLLITPPQRTPTILVMACPLLIYQELTQQPPEVNPAWLTFHTLKLGGIWADYGHGHGELGQD